MEETYSIRKEWTLSKHMRSNFEKVTFGAICSLKSAPLIEWVLYKCLPLHLCLDTLKSSFHCYYAWKPDPMRSFCRTDTLQIKSNLMAISQDYHPGNCFLSQMSHMSHIFFLRINKQSHMSQVSDVSCVSRVTWETWDIWDIWDTWDIWNTWDVWDTWDIWDTWDTLQDLRHLRQKAAGWICMYPRLSWTNSLSKSANHDFKFSMATVFNFSEFWWIMIPRATFPENFKFLALTVALLSECQILWPSTQQYIGQRV